MVKTNEKISKTNSALTDPELYALCKKCGAEALQARRKFIGLLPEVNTRRLYERRKFHSIYHFAAALGGVGRRLVDEVLRLEKRFEAMPKLHSALVNGEIGLSKLTRIVSIVNVENEAEICEKIRLLSRRAVDVFVKDMLGARAEILNSDGLYENQIAGDATTVNLFEKLELGNRQNEVENSGNSNENQQTIAVEIENCPAENSKNKTEAPDQGVENQDGLQKPQLNPKSLSGREKQIKSQNVDYEIVNALSPEVKAKLKELIDKEIDINEILLSALAKREENITEKKAEIGQTPAKSRYIPVKILNIIREEFGSKCAYPNCQNPAEQIHHEKPFALHQDHNPRDLKPLCRGHHELEHVR